MKKQHLLSSISMQSDNRWKGNFKKKGNLGSLATPISLVLSKNKIDFSSWTGWVQILGLPLISQVDLTSLSPGGICGVRILLVCSYLRYKDLR